MRNKNFNQLNFEEEKAKEEIKKLQKKIEEIREQKEEKTKHFCLKVTPRFSKQVRKYATKNEMTVSKMFYDGLKILMEKED